MKLKLSLSTFFQDLFVKTPVFQAKCCIELITPSQNLYIYFYKSFRIFYINNNNFVCFAKKLVITCHTRSSGGSREPNKQIQIPTRKLEAYWSFASVDGFCLQTVDGFLVANDATFTQHSCKVSYRQSDKYNIKETQSYNTPVS